MGFLDDLGREVLITRAQKYARKITNEVKTHVTNEVERIMQEIEDLRAAVDQELSDDAAQNTLIADLQARLSESQAAQAELEAATAAAIAGEADAEARLADAQAALSEALAGAVEATTALRSNDPAPADPGTGETPVEEPAPAQEPDPIDTP